jgi:CRP-like cAMP-binding protein
LFLVLDGAVEVRLLENPGRYSGVRLATRNAGTCIGEYAFIDDKPASAAVIAVEPSELFKIHYKSLEALLANNDTLGRTFYRNLLVHLVDRLRATNAELDLFRPI